MKITMAHAVRSVILLALVSIQVGCGYMAQTTRDMDYSELGVGSIRGSISKTPHSTNRCTANFLLKNWGKPESKLSIDNDAVIWSYPKGLRWSGAAPIILFPLPFFIPVGRETVRFTLKGEDIAAIHHITAHRTLLYFPSVSDNNITVGLTLYGPAEEDCLFKKTG